MKWPTIALLALLILSFVGLLLPRVTGIATDRWPDALRWGFVGAILLAMFVLGEDQRRKEKAADKWVGDPSKSVLENWLEKRRQRFSPARGLYYFILGVVVFSITAGVGAMLGEVSSIGGAFAFIFIMSLLAGLFGIFTDNVPM